MRVSDHTENAVGAIQAGPTAAAPSEPMGQPDHSTDEAVALARLLFPVMNLEAMRQMEGGVISRPRHDETRTAYVDTLLNLYDQTAAWGQRLENSPIPPQRIRDLRLGQLVQQSAEAAQHSGLMADRYREQSFRRSTAATTGDENVYNGGGQGEHGQTFLAKWGQATLPCLYTFPKCCGNSSQETAHQDAELEEAERKLHRRRERIHFDTLKGFAYNNFPNLNRGKNAPNAIQPPARQAGTHE